MSVLQQQFDWSPARLVELRELIDLGMSAKRIGQIFGVSRSCITGKAYRLGWRLGVAPGVGGVPGTEPPPRKPRKPRDYALERLRRAMSGPRFPSSPVPVSSLPPGKFDLLDLPRNGCHWPSGDGPYLFCGEPRFEGCDTHYCEAHHWASRRPLQAMRISETERARRRRAGTALWNGIDGGWRPHGNGTQDFREGAA